VNQQPDILGGQLDSMRIMLNAFHHQDDHHTTRRVNEVDDSGTTVGQEEKAGQSVCGDK